jgi:uncharacterized membrane protein HdeD (DUF308 family)
MNQGGKMDTLIAGVPIMALVLGLVEFAKKFNVTGKWSMLLAGALGLLFGVVAFAMSQGIPVSWQEWVTALVSGLVYGLAAAGVYDLGKKFLVRE